MKKILFAFVAGCIPALVFTNSLVAQTSVHPEVLEPQKNATVIQKVVNSENGSSADVTGINNKALNRFAKAYKNVTGASWEIVADGFVATFTSDGVRNTIYYNKNGTWAGSLKGYEESKMPTNIRKLIKPTYYDYAITYVQEAETILSNGLPTYIIHLQNNETIKLLRVYDGEVELWKDYPRGN